MCTLHVNSDSYISGRAPQRLIVKCGLHSRKVAFSCSSLHRNDNNGLALFCTCGVPALQVAPSSFRNYSPFSNLEDEEVATNICCRFICAHYHSRGAECCIARLYDHHQ